MAPSLSTAVPFPGPQQSQPQAPSPPRAPSQEGALTTSNTVTGGTLTDSTFSVTGGAISGVTTLATSSSATIGNGLTVTTGGATVSAGGLTVTDGVNAGSGWGINANALAALTASTTIAMATYNGKIVKVSGSGATLTLTKTETGNRGCGCQHHDDGEPFDFLQFCCVAGQRSRYLGSYKCSRYLILNLRINHTNSYDSCSRHNAAGNS